jgi:hypothetical protein
MNKTLLDMKLLLEYYKNNNILDRYSSGMGFGDGRLILDNDVMNVLDNIEEKIFIEPLNKKIGKDKEIDRLNNVINELEKCLEINHKIIDIYVERIDKATELLKLAQESGLISISTLMKILKGDRQ